MSRAESGIAARWTPRDLGAFPSFARQLPGVFVLSPDPAVSLYNKVKLPADALLGPEGAGFKGSQTRLSGGRIHHAMRAVGTAQRALDMACERVLSRETKGSLLAEKQMVQESIADSYIQLRQFRLHVLYAAWLIDKHKSYNREVRREIAAVKVSAPKVLLDVVYRCLHLHGSLGGRHAYDGGQFPLDHSPACARLLGHPICPSVLSAGIERHRLACATPFSSWLRQRQSLLAKTR